ncbi:MAG: NlpC/P60 family protein [Planctomycetota bacterium]|jgi:hypothetical protein
MHPRANEIVECAHTLIGVPFRHQGRDLRGIDCVGVPIYIAKDLGIKEWNSVAYPPRPNMALFEKLIRDTGSREVLYGERAHGDMLRVMSFRFPVHIGIYVVSPGGQEFMIHAFQPFKKVIKTPLNAQEWKKVHSVWRFPE